MNTVSAELIPGIIENLKKNEMEALYFPTAEAARNEVLKRIPPAAKVGIGGSVTLREIGLLEALRQRGNEVYDHWKEGLSKEERQAVGKKHRVRIFL